MCFCKRRKRERRREREAGAEKALFMFYAPLAADDADAAPGREGDWHSGPFFEYHMAGGTLVKELGATQVVSCGSPFRTIVFSVSLAMRYAAGGISSSFSSRMRNALKKKIRRKNELHPPSSLFIMQSFVCS